MNPIWEPERKEIINLKFEYLPPYAQFIIDNALEEFARTLLRVAREINIPLLRHLPPIDDEQLIALGKERNRAMLAYLAQNDPHGYIELSRKSWLSNETPLIHRDDVAVEDITLANFARKKVLRDFLPRYTSDLALFMHITEEINMFTSSLDIDFFKSFIELQREKINTINVALQKREAELLEAQAIGQIGSFEWDFTGKKSSYTPQVFKIFEMEQASTLPSFLEDVHPDDRSKLQTAIETSFKTGNFECEYRYLKNNKKKTIWSRGIVSFDQTGKPLGMKGTLMDVTERHKIVERLQQSEELHKQAQALTHLGNWSWVVGQEKVVWSDEMYRIHGIEPQSEEITFERFLSFVHPEDKEKRREDINRSLQSHLVEENHFRIKLANGQIKVLRARGEVVIGNDNSSLKMVGTCQDITHEFLLNQELKAREEYLASLNLSLEQKNQELIRSNKELESFNFIASHDLQEPLRKIRVYCSRILEHEKEQFPAASAKFLEKINDASVRMQKLIDDFLSFSQAVSISQNFEPVDLGALLEEVRSELLEVIEEKKAVIESSPLPVVNVIQFQFKQLLLNLIGNSLKYCDKNIAPHISVAGTVIPGAVLLAEEATASGEKTYFKLTIADNGIGFEQKYATRIFELFQRLHTRDKYSGTGIGLAICKKIADNHMGFIKATGKPEAGAVFTVYIPLDGQ